MDEISLEQWKKLDIRVGEILEVDDHPHADRLYVMTIDIGKEKRKVVAGIKDHYDKDDLIGKKVIVFTNLKPVELRGITSEGMILAAVEEGDEEKVILLGPEQDIANGAIIK